MNKIKETISHMRSSSDDSHNETQSPRYSDSTSRTTPATSPSTTAGRTGGTGSTLASNKANMGSNPASSPTTGGSTGAASGGRDGVLNDGTVGGRHHGVGTGSSNVDRAQGVLSGGQNGSSTNTGSTGSGLTGNRSSDTGTNAGLASNRGSSTGTGSTGAGIREAAREVAPGRAGRADEDEGEAPHTRGHSSHADPTDLRGGDVDQSVEHLGHITDEKRHRHEIEEVQRQKELHTHKTHIQHHVQHVADEQHNQEEAHRKIHPTTKIDEKHQSTTKDRDLLNAVTSKHGYRDQVQSGQNEHQIVDKGETIDETVHHHVKNVVQPVLHRDVHDHHRTQTVIPTHHTVHHAPIIHESIEHQPISKEEFLKGGGALGASHPGQSSLLASGKCDRTVDGTAEQLARDMKLSPGRDM